MEVKNELEKLRAEMKALYEVAPSGSHGRVAKELNVSVSYLWQIKNGRNANVDNEKNRELLTKINSAYISIIEAKMEEIKTLGRIIKKDQDRPLVFKK